MVEAQIDPLCSYYISINNDIHVVSLKSLSDAVLMKGP